MLQTVGMLGPLRLSAPLTQALSAPLLGRMHARSARWRSMFAVCLAIRLALYAALTSFTVFVLLGPAGYKGSFDALFGWLPFLPDGLAGALLITAITQFIAAVFFSTIQVGLYRRALGAWPEPGLAGQRQIAAAPQTVERAGADPRAVLAAAAVVTAVLLFTHAWVVLGAVAVWLAGAAVLARHGDRDVVKIGLLLTATLAAGTLIGSLVGGLGVDEAASRTVRAALLVLVATWMRAAAEQRGTARGIPARTASPQTPAGSSRCGTLLGELDSGGCLPGRPRRSRNACAGCRIDRFRWRMRCSVGSTRGPRGRAGELRADGDSAARPATRCTLAVSVLLPAAALLAAVGG